MRTTFGRFDKELFMKVHRYSIVYCNIFDCGSLTKFFLILEGLFPQRSSGMPQFDFWSLIVNLFLLWKAFLNFGEAFQQVQFLWNSLFFNPSSGPHLDATIISENIFKSSSIDAIIFNCGPLIWMLLLF